MTPSEIMKREILKIPGIRVPMADMTVKRIFAELEDSGYAIEERKPQCSTSPTSPSSSSR